MLSGEKPMAMFGDAVGYTHHFPEADFAPYVADGTFVRKEVVYRPKGGGVACQFVYFARASEEWRIEAMHRIHERVFVDGVTSYAETEREIGRLLGYTEADIEQFLLWVEECRSRLWGR